MTSEPLTGLEQSNTAEVRTQQKSSNDDSSNGVESQSHLPSVAAVFLVVFDIRKGSA